MRTVKIFRLSRLKSSMPRECYEPTQTSSLNLRLQGPGSLGVGNADLTSREAYNAKSRRAYQGRALVVIRSTNQLGTTKTHSAGRGFELRYGGNPGQ